MLLVAAADWSVYKIPISIVSADTVLAAHNADAIAAVDIIFFIVVFPFFVIAVLLLSHLGLG
jgi:hypothetical protein